MLGIKTIGNATLVAYDKVPILSTDPWFGDEHPAYFGSWILTHKIPQDIKKDILKKKNSTRGRPKKNIVKLNNTDSQSDESISQTTDESNEEYKLDVEKIYINEQLFYKTKTGLFLDSDLKVVDIETVR